MEREKATKMLRRILATVCETSFTAPVRRVYVFGSYALGSLNPGDIDLMIIYDLPADHAERMERHRAKRLPIAEFLDTAPEVRYQTEISKKLRKPGEKLDVLPFQTSEFESERFFECLAFDKNSLRLLWTTEDQDWEPKLAALLPDPSIQRQPRREIFPLKRLTADLDMMQEACDMLEAGEITLKTIPLEEVKLKFTPEEADAIRRYSLQHGKKTAKLIPYLIAWGKMHRQKMRSAGHDCVSWSFARTHVADIGRPSLNLMLCYFRSYPEVVRHALIPHLKAGGPNAILEFQRGPNWKTRKHYT